MRHQQLLTREASHRVKNSRAMVSALLALRMRGIEDPELQQVLVDAHPRIGTIARAHDLLWRGDRVGTAPLMRWSANSPTNWWRRYPVTN